MLQENTKATIVIELDTGYVVLIERNEIKDTATGEVKHLSNPHRTPLTIGNDQSLDAKVSEGRISQKYATFIKDTIWTPAIRQSVIDA